MRFALDVWYEAWERNESKHGRGPDADDMVSAFRAGDGRSQHMSDGKRKEYEPLEYIEARQKPSDR